MYRVDLPDRSQGSVLYLDLTMIYADHSPRYHLHHSSSPRDISSSVSPASPLLPTDIPVELYPMAFVVAAACVGAAFGGPFNPLIMK